MAHGQGKAYANKRKQEDRPKGDFYCTPKSLIWVAEDVIKREFNDSMTILEPCYGSGSISDAVRGLGFDVVDNDLYTMDGKDYCNTDDFDKYLQVITNPPFSMWDEFVYKSKEHCNRFMMIGRLNYLGTYRRYNNNIWENLKSVHIFNRYVDYQTPHREDGLFHVGAMATGWFLWDMAYFGEITMEILDVQPYAKLGNF